ncbi:DUF1778 domain-containing protein [Cellulosimicrobium cellulans]|uniref:type II toxin-antitoxin system TacA family antitoxin n=1 Tax=Cellulosimicrobium cellulans TaxID=1710 RepID=UPI00130E310D|nr:DUF1778 domain-containing protein [Cellulosimicrobium cellulans]
MLAEPTPTERTARLNMRIAPRALDTIRRAAAAQQQDVSSFVLGAAMERARTVLVEEGALLLTAREAAQLDEALARDARVVPELAALLREARELRTRTPGGGSARV